MEVVVVCESMFGNTRMIAEAIADGLRASDSDTRVAVLPVAEATPDSVGTVDLLVVGGPTHFLGMSSARSRRMGLQFGTKSGKPGTAGPELEPGAAGPGVREWLEDLPLASDGSRAAVFDTRLGFPRFGGAARSIARRLRRHGYKMAARPRGFFVKDMAGPLCEGEHDRARTWGTGLVPQPDALNVPTG